MLNQEDDLNHMKRRLCAIMQSFDVKWDDLRDEDGALRFRMRSALGDRKRLYLVERTSQGGGYKAGRDMASIVASAKKFRADVVMLDPLVSLPRAPAEQF